MKTEFLILNLSFLGVQFSSANPCGLPGRPHHSYVIPRKEIYNDGEQVTYVCHPGYYTKSGSKFVKESKRTCQCNGTWNGTLSGCNYQDILYNNRKIIPQNWLELIDENYETCQLIEFNRTYGMAKLEIQLLDTPDREYLPSFSKTFYFLIYLGKLNLTTDPTMSVSVQMEFTSVHNCTRNDILLSELEEIVITCEMPHVIGLKKVNFLFSSPYINSAEIPVCSIKAVTTTNLLCSSPDRPLNGNLDMERPNCPLDKCGLLNILYYCNSGYTLVGSNSSSCFPHPTHGFDFTKPTPLCIPEGANSCFTLPAVQNGRLVPLTSDCPLPNLNFFSTARVQCHPGYTLGCETLLAYCTASTHWRWEYNLSQCETSPHENECILLATDSEYLYSEDTIIVACISTAFATCIITALLILACYMVALKLKGDKTLNRRIVSSNAERKKSVQVSSDDLQAESPIYDDILNYPRPQITVESRNDSDNTSN